MEMRHSHLSVILWGLCGASSVGCSCIYLAGIANLGLSNFGRALITIAPTVLLTGGCVGLAGVMLHRSGYVTAVIAGSATLIAIIASQFADIMITGSEPGHPWYTDMVGIIVGIVFGWSILWCVHSVAAYLDERTMSRPS